MLGLHAHEHVPFTLQPGVEESVKTGTKKGWDLEVQNAAEVSSIAESNRIPLYFYYSMFSSYGCRGFSISLEQDV
jgi:hypothetical protein